MKHRLLWLDFLRGLAVLGMIEAHSVNSFLAPIYRSGGWFAILSYINGWVAPTFLFIAGFLQGAWVRKNWDAPKPLIPKLRHLGVILLIGYGLQFPWDHAFAWAPVSVALGKVDVLHCIAVTLAILLLLTKVCKKWPAYNLSVLFLASIVVISAPFIWAMSLSTHPLAGYLSPHNGALFPLFPWSGFILAGTLVGTRDTGKFPIFAVLFTAATAVGWTLHWLLTDWQQTQTYATRYDAFCFRLALVLLGCAVCSWCIRSEKPNHLTRGINWCGSHSLSLYVWHLILLHSGLGLVPPLRSLFPKTQVPGTVFWLYLLTLGGTLLLTLLWQKLAAIISQNHRQPDA